MQVIFSELAFQQYLDWQYDDRRVLKEINALIKDIQTNGFMQGAGKPKQLKGFKAFSRRIDNLNRLVYTGNKRRDLVILSCKGHYDSEVPESFKKN